MNTDWRPDDEDTDSATNEGFSGANSFAGIFEGNGYSISNLYSRATVTEGSLGVLPLLPAYATWELWMPTSTVAVVGFNI